MNNVKTHMNVINNIKYLGMIFLNDNKIVIMLIFKHLRILIKIGGQYLKQYLLF